LDIFQLFLLYYWIVTCLMCFSIIIILLVDQVGCSYWVNRIIIIVMIIVVILRWGVFLLLVYLCHWWIYHMLWLGLCSL